MDKTTCRQRLDAFGIAPTSQRLEIARVLLAQPQHLSAEQVLVMVNKDKAAVSKATVYNTLGLFARKGLIREVIVDPSRVFYDSNTTEHGHVYNVDSGELTDVSINALGLVDFSTLPASQEVAGVDVIIRVRSRHSSRQGSQT